MLSEDKFRKWSGFNNADVAHTDTLMGINDAKSVNISNYLANIPDSNS